jgi:hypothetical protein
MVKALHTGGGRTHKEVGQNLPPHSRDKVSVGKVSGIGNARVHATGHEGAPLLTSIPPMRGAPPHGNVLADAIVAGPGGSRTVRPSGHQGTHSGKAEPAHPGPRPPVQSSDPLAAYKPGGR